MRKLIATAAGAIAVVSGFVVPAHAEQVDIGVSVSSDFSATPYGSSTKPGEDFGNFTVVRVSVTDAGPGEAPGSVVAKGGDEGVGPIDGATTGVAVYGVLAHPMNGTEPSVFAFTSVTTCVKTPISFTCTPGVGEHTLISALTGP